MTDEEFVFRQTERERKRDGRGTFNKVRQGGRYVRFPSDNLTKKEKEKMNGMVSSYNFSKPLTWKQFIGMPDDLCQEYLNTLAERFYGVSTALIGESMGADSGRYGPYFSRHGLKTPVAKKMNRETFLKSDDGKKWIRWLAGEEPIEEKPDVDVPVAHVSEKPDIVENIDIKKDSVDVHNIATLLQMLQGTGAKLTIEISL